MNTFQLSDQCVYNSKEIQRLAKAQRQGINQVIRQRLDNGENPRFEVLAPNMSKFTRVLTFGFRALKN